MDIYEIGNMLTAVETIVSPRRFFLDNFFSRVVTSAAKSIMFDIIKGTRKIAPYVSPRVAGKIMEKKGYKTMSYAPAYVKPKTVTTAGDFLKRMAGEVVFGGSMTPNQRASEQLVDELMFLEDIIVRRLEQMCSEAVQTGKLVIVGDGVDEVIDFMMDPDNLPVFTGADLWSAHATAKPLSDIRRLKKQGVRKSGVAATDLILGTDAYEDFLQCDEVAGSTGGKKGLFDITRITMGQINPQELPDGVTYVGRLTETALDVWTYDEWYVDENSNEEIPMVNPDNIILGSRNGEGMQCYGAIEDVEAVEAGMYAVPRYPKVWTEKDPSARYLMVQAAPLIVPKRIDSWLCAKVR